MITRRLKANYNTCLNIILKFCKNPAKIDWEQEMRIAGLLIEEYGEEFPIKIAGQINDFNPESYAIGTKEAKRMDRSAQFGIAATLEALRDSNLHIGSQEGDVSPEDVDISLGVGGG